MRVIATVTDVVALSCPPPPWFCPVPAVPPPVTLLLLSFRTKLICALAGGASEVLRYATAPIALPTSGAVALALKVTVKRPPVLVKLPIVTPSTTRFAPEVCTPSAGLPVSSSMKLNTSCACAVPLRCTVNVAPFQLPPSSASATVTLPSASSRTAAGAFSTKPGAPVSAEMVGASLIGLTVVDTVVGALKRVEPPVAAIVCPVSGTVTALPLELSSAATLSDGGTPAKFATGWKRRLALVGNSTELASPAVVPVGRSTQTPGATLYCHRPSVLALALLPSTASPANVVLVLPPPVMPAWLSSASPYLPENSVPITAPVLAALVTSSFTAPSAALVSVGASLTALTLVTSVTLLVLLL